MSAITPVMPRQQAPKLEIDLVGGGTWNLADQTPENFTLVVVYRGYHCPICKNYLGDLQGKLDDFAAKGVNVIVLSSDDKERAGHKPNVNGLPRRWPRAGFTCARSRPADRPDRTPQRCGR